MATYHKWKDLQDIESLKKAFTGERLLWIHRPILLHDRSNNGAVCLCGCNSRRAATVGPPVEHIDLLVDKITGVRVLLRPDHPEPFRAKFHALAAKAKKIDAPVRCFAKQLPFILDTEHKIQVFFGGARGGKTSAGVEWFADGIYLLGGPGAQIWWVAPTREKTHIGVRKLILGEKTDRSVRAVIPPELVVSYPKNWRAADQKIVLIDGTTIFLKYGGRDGGNLKGDPAQRIFIDELCEIDHAINFQICLDRLTDSGGQLGGATTPVAGNWAREEIFEIGVTHEVAARKKAKGEVVDVIVETASAYENPFQDPKEVDRRVRAGGGRDNPKVRREVFGEWIGEGPTMWPHFFTEPKSEKINNRQHRISHLRDGPWRDVDGWGLVNVSQIAGSGFWDGNPNLDTIAGQDFNVWPMSVVVGQIACPPDLDQSDPDNWILFITDEVMKKGNIYDFADFLATKAGSYRGRKLPKDYFAGLPIACDSTGAQINPPATHNFTQTGMTLAQVMRDHGFDCRPCHWSENDKPVNPSKVDQASLLHKLMTDRVVSKTGVWPRLIVHATRCKDLIHSLTTQESDDKGRPLKEAGTASDRLSGPVDALLYLAWAMFADNDIYRSSGAEFQW